MRASGVSAERARAIRGHHHERRGAVVHAGRVAGGDRAVLLERRLQPAERLGRRVCANRFVAIDDERLALLLRNRDRQDLVGEPALRASRAPPCDGCSRRSRPAPRARPCSARRRLRRTCPCGTARTRTTGRRGSSSRRARRCPSAALRDAAAAGTAQLLIDSMPPATATSMSPVAMPCAASITAFSPEPQTLLIVSAATWSARPPLSAACRAGFWPMPALDDVAHDAFVRRARGRCRRGARPRARRCAPSSVALKSFSAPRNLPVAVCERPDDDGFTHDELVPVHWPCGARADSTISRSHHVGSEQMPEPVDENRTRAHDLATPCGGRRRDPHDAVLPGHDRRARDRRVRRRSPRERDLRRARRLIASIRIAERGTRLCAVTPCGGLERARRPRECDHSPHVRLPLRSTANPRRSSEERRRAAASRVGRRRGACELLARGRLCRATS